MAGARAGLLLVLVLAGAAGALQAARVRGAGGGGAGGAPLTNLTAWLHALEIHVPYFNFTEVGPRWHAAHACRGGGCCALRLGPRRWLSD